MINGVAVVTDSAAMLPPELRDRFGVLVAALTVTVDEEEFRDGIDIGPDDFYEAMASAQKTTTSQPSPGRLLDCYRQAADQGAKEIISIHIGSGISGTVNSARTAAQSSPIPVTVVDTAQASFAEGLCVWEACDALSEGAPVAQAALRAKAAGSAVGNTFVVKALDLVRRGGRLRDEGAAAEGVPVMALKPDGMHVVGTAATLDDAVSHMAAQIEEAAAAAGARGGALRVGIGHGAAPEIASALRARVEAMRDIVEVIDYVVGPGIGAHLGPGNAGAVFIARPVR